VLVDGFCIALSELPGLLTAAGAPPVLLRAWLPPHGLALMSLFVVPAQAIARPAVAGRWLLLVGLLGGSVNGLPAAAR